jgi:very-short-patch-repair endonuclease
VAPDGPPVEGRLAALASRQHGVVSRAQLSALGIRGNAISRRVAAGWLQRVHRGVYAVGHTPGTPEMRWMAAVLACGPGAVLSHLDAAALWRIYKGTGARVHITTTRAAAGPAGVRTHRARRLSADDVTVHRRIAVTTVARTLVDLTDVLGRDRLLRAVRESEYLGLLDVDALSAAMERALGRRHLGALKQALAQHRPGQIVRDELEHRFLELIRDAGLPEPETNARVRTKRRDYSVDCLWRDERVAVELDGRTAHARVSAFELDRERDAALSAVGLRLVRFTWRRVQDDGGEVISDLRAILGAAPVSG